MCWKANCPKLSHQLNFIDLQTLCCQNFTGKRHVKVQCCHGHRHQKSIESSSFLKKCLRYGSGFQRKPIHWRAVLVPSVKPILHTFFFFLLFTCLFFLSISPLAPNAYSFLQRIFMSLWYALLNLAQDLCSYRIRLLCCAGSKVLLPLTWPWYLTEPSFS